MEPTLSQGCIPHSYGAGIFSPTHRQDGTPRSHVSVHCRSSPEDMLL